MKSAIHYPRPSVFAKSLLSLSVGLCLQSAYAQELEKSGRAGGITRFGNPDELKKHLVRKGVFQVFEQMVVQEQMAASAAGTGTPEETTTSNAWNIYPAQMLRRSRPRTRM